MKKRVISLLLIVALCLVSLPSMAAAIGNELDTVCIYIFNGKGKQAVSVIPTNVGDLLFDAEDLALLSSFGLTENGQNLIFTRGKKSIAVNTEKGVLSPGEDISDISLGDGVVIHEGRTYLSGANLLPWLNVSCLEKDGGLYILPDAVSFWDIADTVELDDYRFDFDDAYSKVGGSSTWLKAKAYILAKGLKSILDIIPVGYGWATIGNYQDYYDMFDGLFKDKSSTAYAASELTAAGDRINSGLGLLGELDTLGELPDGLQAMSAAFKAFTVTDFAADIALFYYSFDGDNSVKIDMMKSIIDNRKNYNYPDAMEKAAIDIKNSYENWFAGIATRTANKLLELSVDIACDVLGIGIISAAVGLVQLTGGNWAEGINRIPKYEALQVAANDVYRGDLGDSHSSTLKQQRCHAMLYFYAAEQNWLAMQNYCAEKKKWDLFNEFGAKAEECKKVYAQYLNTLPAQENDSCEYAGGLDKAGYTSKLLDMFTRVTQLEEGVAIKAQPVTKSMQFLDYALLLLDCPDPDMIQGYTLNDADGDGDPELLVVTAGPPTGRFGLVTADASNFSSTYYSETGAAQSIEFAVETKTKRVVFGEYYSSASYMSRRYFGWDGQKWGAIYDYQGRMHDINQPAWEAENNTWSGDWFLGINSQPTGEAPYELSTERFSQVEYFDLFNLYLEGDPNTLLQECQDHFTSYPTYNQTLAGDIDGDGQDETLIFVTAPANRFWDNLDVMNSWNGEDEYLNWRKQSLGVVVCKPTAGGMMFYPCTLPFKEIYGISVDSHLKIETPDLFAWYILDVTQPNSLTNFALKIVG